MHSLVKWVGGKTRILEKLVSFVPEYSGTYFEPMLGGASLFFRLQPDRAVISDLNPRLIGMYEAVRDQIDGVLAHLYELGARHAKAPEETYYAIRTEFNSDTGAQDRHAAMFIYLNKTTYNGLWRVNKSGAYNAAWGKRKTYEPDEENLRECSRALQKATITHGPYRAVLRAASAGDFVYLDPPYVGAYSSFTSASFGEEDHLALAQMFRSLVDRGCKVLLSNSNQPLVHSLYCDFPMVRVWSSHTVSLDPDTRGKVAEVLVLGGFEVPEHAKDSIL